MIDFVSQLGLSAGWNFVFKPILEELAKHTAEDLVKDYCKETLKGALYGKRAWHKAIGQTIKLFLQEFRQQLVDAGETDESAKRYVESLARFIKIPKVREMIGKTLTDSANALDAFALDLIWRETALERLPQGFDWSSFSQQFSYAAQEIMRASDELRQILNSCNLQIVADALQDLAGVPADGGLSKYAEAIKKRYGFVELSMFDAQLRFGPIELTKIFVEQTVCACYELDAHRDYTSELRDLDVEDDERIQPEEINNSRTILGAHEIQSQEHPALSIVGQENYRLCVLLGDAGSGKSTVLQYIATEWAERKPVELTAEPTPLFVELKSFAENVSHGICRNFLEYFDHGLGVLGQLDQHWVDLALKRGHALLLIDGFDEVPDEPMRLLIAQDIARLAIRYPLARFLVTSRLSGYENVAAVLRDVGFKHFMLLPFNTLKQRAFVERWHSAAYPEGTERQRKATRLCNALVDDPAVNELAGNPLLLTLVALLNNQHTLPRERSALYGRASVLMLQRWEASKSLRVTDTFGENLFDLRLKEKILRALAWEVQDAQSDFVTTLISADVLQNTVKECLDREGFHNPGPVALQLIRQLRSRSSVLRSQGDSYYSFAHESFFAFFYAWAWVWKLQKEQVVTLDALKRQTFEAHWQHQEWHNVLRFIASQMEASIVISLVEYLVNCEDRSSCRLNILLAATIFADNKTKKEVGQVADLLYRAIEPLTHFSLPFAAQSRTESKLEQEIASAAVRLVIKCWPTHQRTLSWAKEVARNGRLRGARLAAIESLVTLARNDWEIPPLLNAIVRNGKDSQTRCTALGELMRISDHDAQTSALLYDLLKTDGDQRVSRAAAEELIRTWKDEPETFSLLKDLALNAARGVTRMIALSALTDGWGDLSDMQPLLVSLISSDKNRYVQRAAIEAIAKQKDKTQAERILKEFVTHGDSVTVRRTSLRQLALLRRDQAETLVLLKHYAQYDRNQYMRRGAVRDLGNYFRHRQDVLELLNERANRDSDPVVRRNILKYFAREFKDNPGTLLLLKNRFRNDRDPGVRRVAIELLWRGWRDDPETRDLLRYCARNDRGAGVRKTALQCLVAEWSDDPETLLIVKNAARHDEQWLVQKAALECLASRWKDDVDLFPMLWEFAQHGINAPIRLVAVRALSRNWNGDLRIFELLERRIKDDKSPRLRRVLVREVARAWKSSSKTQDLLEHCARHDHDGEVRKIAARELAFRRKGTLGTKAKEPGLLG